MPMIIALIGYDLTIPSVSRSCTHASPHAPVACETGQKISDKSTRTGRGSRPSSRGIAFAVDPYLLGACKRR